MCFVHGKRPSVRLLLYIAIGVKCAFHAKHCIRKKCRDKCILRKIIHAVGVIAVSDADKLPIPDKLINSPVVYTKPCKLFFFTIPLCFSMASAMIVCTCCIFITASPSLAYRLKASWHHVIQADTGSQAY